jgi:hypothetical protein
MNPESVTMELKTGGGDTLTLPCKVSKVRDKTRITADYNSFGATIVRGDIYIGNRRFARARIDRGVHLVGVGPTEFGGDF